MLSKPSSPIESAIFYTYQSIYSVVHRQFLCFRDAINKDTLSDIYVSLHVLVMSLVFAELGPTTINFEMVPLRFYCNISRILGRKMEQRNKSKLKSTTT